MDRCLVDCPEKELNYHTKVGVIPCSIPKDVSALAVNKTDRTEILCQIQKATIATGLNGIRPFISLTIPYDVGFLFREGEGARSIILLKSLIKGTVIKASWVQFVVSIFEG